VYFQVYTRENFTIAGEAKGKTIAYSGRSKFALVLDILLAVGGDVETILHVADGPDHVFSRIVAGSKQFKLSCTGCPSKFGFSVVEDHWGAHLPSAHCVFIDWSGPLEGRGGAERENYDDSWTAYASNVTLGLIGCRVVMVKCRIPITSAMSTFMDSLQMNCVGMWKNPNKDNLEVYFVFNRLGRMDWRRFLSSFLYEKLGRRKFINW